LLYRKFICSNFDFFQLKQKHSDILVGFKNIKIKKTELQLKLKKRLNYLYNQLEKYINKYPDFKKSLKPWSKYSNIDFIKDMIKYSRKAGVGPMASVAGAFSEQLLNTGKQFADTVIIENGGDIAINNHNKNLSLMIYPGWGDFNYKTYLTLPKGFWGIASSSGKFGHSQNFGEADMVTVITKQPTEADAFATSISNKIKKGKAPSKLIQNHKSLSAICIIWGDKIWYKGNFEIDFS